MDVLGGGYTPTFGELGEEEKLIINSSGNIKVTFKLRAPLNLFFYENPKIASQIATNKSMIYLLYLQ